MPPGRVRTWGDWFYEVFMRGGLFSLRRLPISHAERQEEAERKVMPPENITKLNLNSDSSHRDSVSN